MVDSRYRLSARSRSAMVALARSPQRNGSGSPPKMPSRGLTLVEPPVEALAEEPPPSPRAPTSGPSSSPPSGPSLVPSSGHSRYRAASIPLSSTQMFENTQLVVMVVTTAVVAVDRAGWRWLRLRCSLAATVFMVVTQPQLPSVPGALVRDSGRHSACPCDHPRGTATPSMPLVLDACSGQRQGGGGELMKRKEVGGPYMWRHVVPRQTMYRSASL